LSPLRREGIYIGISVRVGGGGYGCLMRGSLIQSLLTASNRDVF
jgi:hypothetical protein